jgi:nicotinate-nucleotide adenylyltransferase
VTPSIGILGGSFDPIHVGHLRIAEEARLTLGLDRVTFVPAGFQWMKEGTDVAPAADRLEMVKLATAENDKFDVSDIEIRRHGPSYTVDTLRAVNEEFGSDTDVYFILGQDAFVGLNLWNRPRELIELCRLAVMPRVDGADVDLADLETKVPGVSERTTVLKDAPRIEVSSSELRARLERGESVRYLVPEAVAAYITRRGLYRSTVTGSRAT